MLLLVLLLLPGKETFLSSVRVLGVFGRGEGGGRGGRVGGGGGDRVPG